MSKPRLLARSLPALVLVAVLVYVMVPSVTPYYGRPAVPVAPETRPRDGYPRLANYNGLHDPWQVPFLAGDDLVVARRRAPIRQLMRASPHTLTLLYERTLQVDLSHMYDLYGMAPAEAPPGWWLVQAGSRLTTAIDASQQWFSVADGHPFARCQDLLVEGESMHVQAVYGSALYVIRGYHSVAAPHPAGALIAPHYSYRTDLSNCNPWALRPWSFNLSTHCPRWHGQTWADFLAHRVAMLVRRGGWRGVFFDNLTDFPASPYVDTNNDGQADGGVLDGVNVWRDGQRALLAEARHLLPGMPILINGDLLINGVADGREMEGFPLIPGMNLSAGIDAYRYDSAAGLRQSIVNSDTVTKPDPSPHSAQLTVGISLLGDGYAAYDEGWYTHGTPWWFDAYDGAAGSATTAPLDPTTMVLPVVHPGRFRPGDVVMLDGEAARVLRVLASGLLVQRGIMGTTAVEHQGGTAVTTAAQRAAGHGYLGQPLGPAQFVPTADWARYQSPVWLLGGPALVNGRRQRGEIRRLTPATTISITSTTHYYPETVSLTLRVPHVPHALRMLVFSARGPAGQSIWLDEPRDRVPLVLRPEWRRYVVPVGGAARLVIGAGRVHGTVELREVQLIGVQAFVLRRDFTRGAVVVNPTDVAQHVTLGRPFRVLVGDQDPWIDPAPRVSNLTVGRYRAIILLNT